MTLFSGAMAPMEDTGKGRAAPVWVKQQIDCDIFHPHRLSDHTGNDQWWGSVRGPVELIWLPEQMRNLGKRAQAELRVMGVSWFLQPQLVYSKILWNIFIPCASIVEVPEWNSSHPAWNATRPLLHYWEDHCVVTSACQTQHCPKTCPGSCIIIME